MRKAIGVLLVLLGFVLLCVIAAGTYVKLALPDTGPAPDLNIEKTAPRIERGKYLANHVSVCMDCHSTRNWNLFAGPMDTHNIGGGGEVFSKDMGFPGTFYAPNITPYALAGWTDGEIFRAITTGVNKQGKALFPLMAYHRFGRMDKEDVFSIIAYLRTLRPVKKDIPESSADFPVNILMNTMPQKAEFKPKPQEADQLAYGAYLVNASGCVDCHSQTEKGKVIPGTEFAGGMEFRQPGGVVRSPNITFDKETGIGNWGKDLFVKRFKAYAEPGYQSPKVAEGSFNTPMPWMMFAGMKPADLEAIYAYLQSLTPVRNRVKRFDPMK